MAWAGRDHASVSRRAATFAALIALVLNVLVPQGFMAAGGSAPGLVLCTGSGPVLIASDLAGQPAGPKAPAKSNLDGPCAFAGHAAAPPLAHAPVLASEAAIWTPLRLPTVVRRALAPALAAPPPEAIGPPAQQA